ncbi:hypothetical protein EV424DRAFT_577569 [Suillus variegatus]|nr:hypothetical protein EV424DRAFT_577569 [Suillus variegatus]
MLFVCIPYAVYFCPRLRLTSARKLDINELPDSPKHEADEEGVTADRMHQAIVESRCERQSLDVNEVSKTFESEPTWIHHSLESGEWHTQRQGRQQVYSSGIVGPQVGESNTTPQFLNITVKNTHTSSTTPDDLWSSPVPEGTPAMEQTPPAGDSLQGAPDRDVTRVRYSSRSSSIPKFEDNNVDVSAGYMRQASVTRGDHHEQRMDSEVEQNLAHRFCSVGMLGRSTSDTVTANNDRRMDKDAEDTAFPLSSTTIRSKLSIAEPDILHDVATSSKVITTLTNSMQTSSYRSTVNNEHVYQQPARTSSWSNESPINQSQTTTPVHLFSVPGENNPTPAQPFGVASSKNTQQPSPAFNGPDSSLPEGVPTTGQTSSPATYECGEPCGLDEARDLPSQGSSTPKLRDDKEDISAYCTFQGVKAGEDHCLKAGPTVTSVTCDSITVQCSSQTNQENTSCAADTRRCDALGNACDTCSIPPDDCGACTNTAPNDCPPADGQLTQTAAIDCAHECPSTMDSLPVESCCPEPKGPLSEPCGDVIKKSSSGDCCHPAPCTEGTSGVKVREGDCTKEQPTVTCGVTCDSKTVQCSSQTGNNTSCAAADTKRCDARDTCSIPSDYCGACTTTAPNDCPPADGQLAQTAATDCAYKCPSTMDSKPCCPEPKGPPSEPCSDVIKKSCSSDCCPAPCTEGTPGVKAQEGDCTKTGSTVTCSVTCDSKTVQCSSQTENNTLCVAADTKQCGARDTCSMPSNDCGACTTAAPNDCPPADEQLAQTAATDCAYKCTSTTDSKSCCPEPKGPPSAL